MRPIRTIAPVVVALWFATGCQKDVAPTPQPQEAAKNKTVTRSITEPLPEEALAFVEPGKPGDCAGSPLLGKYLWNFGTAESGGVEPFKDDCTCLLAFDGSKHHIELTWKGMTLDLPGPKGRVLPVELSRTLNCPSARENAVWESIGIRKGSTETDAQFEERTQAWCKRMEELLAMDEALYFGVRPKDRVVIPESMFYLGDHPFEGTLKLFDEPSYRKIFPDAEARKTSWLEQKKKAEESAHGGHKH